MPIVHHNIEEANYQPISKCHTVITFRTQQLLDLWKNEMCGQISDGMWENSRNTEWLWKDVYVKLGDTTKVENDNGWAPKRVSFGLGKELWDVVGNRIMEESGFENKRQAVLAWTEIAQAIKNWTRFSPETQKEYDEDCKRVKDIKSVTVQRMNEEWTKTGLGWHESYGYTSRDTLYIDQENKKGYISVTGKVDTEGKGTWQLEYNYAKFYIPEGKLIEGIAKIRNFYMDWEKFVTKQ